MMPPLWMTLKFGRLTLWLPLFILWLLLLVLLSPVIALLLLMAFFLIWTREGRQWFRVAGQLWVIFCSVRGLNVEVANAWERIYIHIL